jgi:hypothetical protein
LATCAPTDRRSLWIFRLVAAVLWTLAILTVCWLPGELVQEVEGESPLFKIPHLDKLIHWGIFAGFALLWLRLGESRRRYAGVILAGVGLAALTEVVQALVPPIHRDGEIGDFLTDSLGVITGIAVAHWVEPLLRRVEGRILPGSRS